MHARARNILHMLAWAPDAGYYTITVFPVMKWNSLAMEAHARSPRVSLSYKLVPVHYMYMEYKYGLFIPSSSFVHGWKHLSHLICWKISSAVNSDHVISGNIGEKHFMAW